MICLLCTKFKKKNIWATTGCKSLRLDVVKEHEGSSEHLNSVNLEVENQNIEECNENMQRDSRKAIADALKVLYYIVNHNLPLDLFSNT